MKLICIKDLIVRYDRGRVPWTEQRLTKGRIYETSDSIIYDTIVPTFIDDCGTQRGLTTFNLEHLITIEEMRERKLNELLSDV